MVRRENRRRRAAPSRDARTTILVVCGGRRTEPQYFDEMRRAWRNPAVAIKILQKSCSPNGIVEYALKFADGFDQVWCVVDTDEFDVQRAVSTAKAAGIEMAVSNPCFELWLLLHRQDCVSHLARCVDVHRKLRRCLPGYDKCRLRFADFEDHVDVAIERARALEPTGLDHGRNPSTGVWRLVGGLRGEGQIP